MPTYVTTYVTTVQPLWRDGLDTTRPDGVYFQETAPLLAPPPSAPDCVWTLHSVLMLPLLATPSLLCVWRASARDPELERDPDGSRLPHTWILRGRRPCQEFVAEDDLHSELDWCSNCGFPRFSHLGYGAPVADPEATR